LKLCSIPIEKVFFEESKYQLIRKIKVYRRRLQGGIEQILERTALITPLLVQEEEQEDYFHLIDGYQRYKFLKSKQTAKLPCMIIPSSATPQRRFELIFNSDLINEQNSLISKLEIVRFALELGVEEDFLLEKYLPMMGFKAYHKIFQRFQRILLLPKAILVYCHEKNFSFKQCDYLAVLTRKSPDLLNIIFSWKNKINLTASVMEELAENIYDYLRENSQQLDKFFKNPLIKKIFAWEGPQNERTKRLRKYIQELRYPRLTDENKQIEEYRRRMCLPKNINVTWDTHLEQSDLVLNIQFNCTTQWKDTCDFLCSSSVLEGFSGMLGKL